MSCTSGYSQPKHCGRAKELDHGWLMTEWYEIKLQGDTAMRQERPLTRYLLVLTRFLMTRQVGTSTSNTTAMSMQLILVIQIEVVSGNQGTWSGSVRRGDYHYVRGRTRRERVGGTFTRFFAIPGILRSCERKI